MNDRMKALADAGVSIWLDDLSRERIETGNLAELMETRSVVGVTTNPSIFAAALAEGERYDAQVRELAAEGADVDATVFALTTTDVRQACDILRPAYDASNGVDGRVSIEVAPTLAFDTDATTAAARALWAEVDRDNLLIKIPATTEGAPAITTVLGEGISVNVTLIFGLERYRGVMEAYVAGLEKARDNGHDLSRIHSVASFFVSRVDTEIDKRLEAIGSDEALALRGKAGVANAVLAYRDFEEFFSGERWEALAAAGAHKQRPLWASTGVKNPDYRDTMYVTDLVVPDTVNTMPEKTIEAFADHGEVTGDRVTTTYADAQSVMDQLAAVGIDYDDVIATLEQEGVEKFEASWAELLDTVSGPARRPRAREPRRDLDARRRGDHAGVVGARRPRRRARPRTSGPGSPRTRSGSSATPTRPATCSSTCPRTSSTTTSSPACSRWPSRSGSTERRDAMLRGERINVTEDRAVLHTALRQPAGAVAGGRRARRRAGRARGARSGSTTSPSGCAPARGPA